MNGKRYHNHLSYETLTRIFRLITYYAIVCFTQPVSRKSYSLVRKNITEHFECTALLSECSTQVTSASLEKCSFLDATRVLWVHIWGPCTCAFNKVATCSSGIPQLATAFLEAELFPAVARPNHLLHVSRDMPILLCFFVPYWGS